VEANWHSYEVSIIPETGVYPQKGKFVCYRTSAYIMGDPQFCQFTPD
jgi:hypothetical protein